jgi:hypothetical protein
METKKRIKDCTLVCGPAMDGKLCTTAECKVVPLWEKCGAPTLDEMRVQCNRWTGDWDKNGQPTFDLREG